MKNPMFHLQLFAEEGGSAPEAGDTGRKAALYDAFAPSLEVLAQKYGIEAEPAALEQALHREQQARQQLRQTQADRLYDAWMDQAEKTREAYPGFDLAAEMKDPRFLGLLKARVDVCTAYEALHRQEAMARTARMVEESLLDRMAYGGVRPRENGTASQGAAVTRQDVSRMTRADRQAIIQRVQRGEKISF